MKGMLDFLEKAGLVKKDEPSEPIVFDEAPTQNPALGNSPPASMPVPAVVAAAVAAGGAGAGGAVALNLEELYASEGIAASVYPAERLLRLLDGLSAMDENTRNMAIRAMDAADESWSIEDPLADAQAKLNALAAHARRLQDGLQALETETGNRLALLRAAQEKRMGDIRKQISELEALASREMARGAQECAEQEGLLQAARDEASRNLSEIARTSQRLQSLSLQFAGLASSPNKV